MHTYIYIHIYIYICAQSCNLIPLNQHTIKRPGDMKIYYENGSNSFRGIYRLLA